MKPLRCPWRVRFRSACDRGTSPYRRVYRFPCRAAARTFVRTIRTTRWAKGSIIGRATVSAPEYAPPRRRR